MGAHIEWLGTPLQQYFQRITGHRIGILRLGRSFKKYGDPYQFSCTVIKYGSLMECKGGTGYKTDILREFAFMRAMLRGEGIRKIVFDRRLKDGTFKHVEIPVEKPRKTRYKQN